MVLILDNNPQKTYPFIRIRPIATTKILSSSHLRGALGFFSHSAEQPKILEKKGELSGFIIPMMLPMSLVQNPSRRLETAATHQQQTDMLTMTRGWRHSYDEWVSGRQCWARTDVGTYLQAGICHFCDMANVLDSVFISISGHTSSKQIGGCWWEVRWSYDERRTLYERDAGMYLSLWVVCICTST